MRFQNKVVVIVGATGGLGTAYARAFRQEGATLLLAARKVERLATLAEELGAGTKTAVADLTVPTSLISLCKQAVVHFNHVDIVVNATGIDVRKPFLAHTDSEITNSININLTGSIRLTHAFLALFQEQKRGIIVHMGGFADGRLAFPYYSVDVATRAGILSFAESVNREVQNPDIIVQFFSPSAADTVAERPYHPIWKEMGSQIVPIEQVAAELLDAVVRKKRVYIMGGTAVSLLAKLNAAFPRLADSLLMNRYRDILMKHLVTNQ